MYPAKVNSPATTLDGGIDDVQTTISLVDASVLPAATNLAVIGRDEDAETILYETINGNDLEDVTREFQGTAKAWDSGTTIARMFTAYDYDTLKSNLEDVDALKHTQGTDTTLGALTADIDFNLHKATDLVVMTVANEAALPAAGIAVGQLCFATAELTLHICTVSS